jgi:diguanylate cyclase (GGDEF)-like protein
MGFVITLRDVSEFVRILEGLRESAMHDPLTGAPNRRLFELHLKHTYEQLQRRPDYLFAVMFADLDGFKLVNDNFGHAAGDQVIMGVAQRIAAAVRPTDIVARMGGDEFVVLLENLASYDDAEAVATRVVDTLGRPFSVGDETIRLTGSVGVAVSDRGYASAEQMIQSADQAMYQAKAQGKSRFCLAAPSPLER